MYVGAEMAGGGAPAGAERRRQRWVSEAALRWVWVAMAGPRSCGTLRRSSLGVGLGVRKSGGRGSAWRWLDGEQRRVAALRSDGKNGELDSEVRG